MRTKFKWINYELRMELRSRSLPLPVERHIQSESPAQRSRPPSHTNAFGFNALLCQSPGDQRRGSTSPRQIRLDNPDPLRDAWRLQRQPTYTGPDRVIIHNDFKPRPPLFDGKPDTWEPFLMQLKLMAKSYRWTDHKFREQVMFALRGEALLFASTLPYIMTENTDSLLQAMRQRFGLWTLPETHRADLYNLRKQTKENLQQYSARVSRLMSRAYPGMQGTAIYEALAVEYMLRGLPDQKLAYEIFTRKPNDLSQAIDLITWHQTSGLIIDNSTKHGSVETQNGTTQKAEGKCNRNNYVKTAERQKAVRNGELSSKENYNTKSEDSPKSHPLKNSMAGAKDYEQYRRQRWSKCFNCRRRGHHADLCPEETSTRDPQH